MHETQVHEIGVNGEKDFSYSIDGDQLIQNTLENRSIKWTKGSDHAGKQSLFQSPDGKTYRYRHDALGRLVEVLLPSGIIHRVGYNDFGDLSQIQRTGIGSIRFSYKEGTRLLEQKDYFDEKGKLIRSQRWVYDGYGRKTQLVNRDAVSGEEEIHSYYYDGVIPGAALGVIPGQLGRLSGVIGPSYAKFWIYREDGKITEEKFVIPGFTTLMTRYEYYSDGSVKSRSFQRIDSSGHSQVSIALTSVLDSVGRESRLNFNDQPLYDLSYDFLSRVSSIAGPHFSMELAYDNHTRKEKGFSQTYSDSGKYSTQWSKDTRGLIEREIFSTPLQTQEHSYRYDDSGFLAQFENNKTKVDYAYEDQQWVNEVCIQGQIPSNKSITIHSEQKKWKFPNGSYTLDDLGRVIQKEISDERTLLSYGPQGRINQMVKFPLQPVNYFYDDEGRRILKKRGNQIEEAYFNNTLLTPDTFLMPVSIGSKTVAYVENNAVNPLSPDTRNSIISEDGLKLDNPEPYGYRNRPKTDQIRPRLIDYALNGYDSDLMAYRAEFRDYDPLLKRFLTPDPLFLEQPEKCLESPVECNLYGYAKNNPVSFLDPTGKYSEPSKALGSTQIVIDGFISQREVGIPLPGMHFQGDGRGFVPSTPDQSRLTIWIDPQSQSSMHHVSESHRVGSSQGFAPDSGNVINVNFGNGIITVDINAKNSAVPFPMNMGTPAIENHFTFVNSEGGWHGTMTGNAFPSWEVNNWSNGFAMPMLNSMEQPGPVNGPFHLFNFTSPRTENF